MSCRKQLGERRSERILFITYDRRYAPQLEILKIIYLILRLSQFGTFKIRVLPISPTTSTALNFIMFMHSPRK